MMEYKGYIGKVEFDDEAGIFHDEVLDTRDVITFPHRTSGACRGSLRSTATSQDSRHC